jgi:hypothetical protein
MMENTQGPILEISFKGINNHAEDLGRIYYWLNSGDIDVNMPKENLKASIELVQNIFNKILADLDSEENKDA